MSRDHRGGYPAKASTGRLPKVPAGPAPGSSTSAALPPVKQKAWELPWRHRDPIMGIDVEVSRYDLDSGGVGIQVTFSVGVKPVAVRVPMERAVGLAMKIIAESYEDTSAEARRKAREA